MNIFTNMLNKLHKLFEGQPSTAVPGAMGDLLATLGIFELGPVRKGTPNNVLGGCKKQLVLVPGARSPAITKEGKAIMARAKARDGGRLYQVMDNFGVTRQEWKMRVNDEKRKANKRWYSGEPASVRAARLGTA